MRLVPKTFDQIGAVRALGLGVVLWVFGILVLSLGGPLAIAWLLFMVSAAGPGVVAIVRTWRAGTWPVAVLLPLAMLLVFMSGLGVVGPLAM
jgi:hypothetical protein